MQTYTLAFVRPLDICEYIILLFTKPLHIFGQFLSSLTTFVLRHCKTNINSSGNPITKNFCSPGIIKKICDALLTLCFDISLHIDVQGCLVYISGLRKNLIILFAINGGIYSHQVLPSFLWHVTT